MVLVEVHHLKAVKLGGHFFNLLGLIIGDGLDAFSVPTTSKQDSNAES